MMFEVIMPALGMAQDTGKLVAWHRGVGDAVTADDILMEVETDKTVMEVPAGADGFIAEIRAEVGADVPVGDVIAMVSRDKISGDTPIKTEVKTQTPPPATPIKKVIKEAPAPKPPPAPAPINNKTDGKILASPKLKRLVKDAGQSLETLVKLGIPQPFHASDFAQLKKSTNPAFIQIEAKIIATELDAFIRRMARDTSKDIMPKSLWLCFIARGLRTHLGQDDIAINLDNNASITGYLNPDKSTLTQQIPLDPHPHPDLTLHDLTGGFITKPPTQTQNQFCIQRIGDTIEMTLSYDAAIMDAPRAVRFINDFCTKLSNPLLGLI
ncbi:MAG: biotin/lipoyl-containing protein [Candidatus Halichondribacter symbioticus]